MRRGPAYTELSLYAQVDADGRLQLVNHLGIKLGATPEEILTRLEKGDYTPADIEHDTGLASDSRYAERVRDIDEPSAARFNADPTDLHEAAGSAGKLCVFAVRLDTFPADNDAATYYIGTNDPDVLTKARRWLLGRMTQLPIAGEYMHRDMFWACRKYGRDTFLLIHYLGTDAMPGVLRPQAPASTRSSTRWPFMPKHFVDKAVQFAAASGPRCCPRRCSTTARGTSTTSSSRSAADSVAETEAILDELFASNEGAYFRCTPDEGERAFLHRFSAGGAVARFAMMNADEVEAIMPLDVALRRNDDDWFAPSRPTSRTSSTRRSIARTSSATSSTWSSRSRRASTSRR